MFKAVRPTALTKISCKYLFRRYFVRRTVKSIQELSVYARNYSENVNKFVNDEMLIIVDDELLINTFILGLGR